MTSGLTPTESFKDYVIRHIPVACLERMAEFFVTGKSGQILLNSNHGQIESFEVKEHHRVARKDERVVS